MSQPAEAALSVSSGEGRHAKDFDWMAKNVPCRTACPAGTDIPGYLEAIWKGDPETAYRINLRDNVFPAVLGRTCTRPCEPACRHGWEGLGEPVAICFAKRSADDFQRSQEPVYLEKLFPESGKTVAVVGGGTAGLTAARELTLWGHNVTVFEQHSEPGGLMMQGIPEFRLPRDTVRREIQQVIGLGMTVHCNTAVDAEKLTELKSEFDAVILAAGTHVPRWPEVPGIEQDHVRHGLEFLKEVNAGGRPEVGKHVVVIGGGFTAVDCCRMAKRFGAEKVTMVYRRSEQEMYIGMHELHQFAEEGVETCFLAAPVSFEKDVARFQETRLELTGNDRPVPVAVPGSDFELKADTVLLGTGQQTADWWKDIEGVYTAGDAITGPGSLIDAIGHAKSVAREVDRALMDTDRFEEVVSVEDADPIGRTREMDALDRLKMPEIAVESRGITDEVETGLSKMDAETEASRCYLCHYKFEIDNDLCIYCDRCLKVKPVDGCIVKVSDLIYDGEDRISGYVESTGIRDYNRLHLDQNACIRCGACVEVCPVECITLQKVTQETRTRG